jgi:alginate O-acetyltransferase complex protein AlgI
MLFYEPIFLFAFFPTFYLLFLLSQWHEGLRRGVILGASLLFYIWSEPLFVPVVLASSLIDHLIGRRIDLLPGRSRQAKALLAAGVLVNMGMLIHYKYTRFLIGSLNGLLHEFATNPITVPNIILPIGVSFIVFEKITYLADIYRRISRPSERFANYLLYVFFFPKLLAGPIIKYHDLENQLASLPAARVEDISAGFVRFMMGVAKKTLIADTLGSGVDRIFEADYHGVGFYLAWCGVILFTFQIYFDFSGYSDMAIGIARMLGFRLRENFDMPYSACSITEFWRRWHISLTTWIREYLYIPLGGNRVPTARIYLNLWICFLASGLWHGAAWTYIVWGAYNGLFLLLDRLFLLRLLDRMPRFVANLIAFSIIVVGWTIFRAHTLDQALTFLFAMVQPDLPGRVSGVFIGPDIMIAAAIAAIICALPQVPGFARMRRFAFATPLRVVTIQTAVSLVFILAVGKAVADPFKPFLYFRF